jgi:preprotein translocase subunit YajC
LAGSGVAVGDRVTVGCGAQATVTSASTNTANAIKRTRFTTD